MFTQILPKYLKPLMSFFPRCLMCAIHLRIAFPMIQMSPFSLNLEYINLIKDRFFDLLFSCSVMPDPTNGFLVDDINSS